MNALYNIFIGPPGSGKGTLSRLCVQELGWAQLSTGDLCRKHIKNRTEIGKQIDFAIKSGKLISDELVASMVCDWLENLAGSVPSIVFDGYPRTVVQARDFCKTVYEKFDSVKLNVIRFIISDDSIIARLGGRYICQNKECQAVYSLITGSVLNPKKGMGCDKCDSLLMRRPDDEADAILERLKIYHHHEQALDFYIKNKQEVLEFDVEKPVLQVFEEFKELVGIVCTV